MSPAIPAPSFDVLTAVAIATLVTTVGLMWCMMRVVPRFATAVLGEEGKRIETLDGLRGLLALSVVVSHAILAQTNDWSGYLGMPRDNFQSRMGSGAVELFFMISAYLFCGAIFRSGGRLAIVRFFENRVMRIVPLYLVCVTGAVLCAFYQQSFALVVPPVGLLRQISRWLMFDFVKTYDVNGIDISRLLGQIWSLRYEWLLYFCIPILAWTVRRFRSSIPVFAGLAAVAIVMPLFAFFVMGAAAAKLVAIEHPFARRGWQVAGVIGLAAAMFLQNGPGGWWTAVALTPFFVAVLRGEGPYRLFALRPLRFLGEISYGVYLVHGLTGWLFRDLVTGAWSATSVGHAYGAMMGWTLSAVLGGTLTFLAVERPTMRWKPVTRFPPMRLPTRSLAPR